jgi:hypothetical protein
MIAALVPVVDSLVEKTGLPRSLIEGLVEQESNFNPRAISKKGAKGLTQLMPGTAKEMGLKKHEVFDPVKNLEAGVRYLSKLRDKYGGDWEKTLAAYNWGQGNVDRKGLEKMPRETRKYLARLLPLTTIKKQKELSKEPETSVDWLTALETTPGYQDPGFPSRESAVVGNTPNKYTFGNRLRDVDPIGWQSLLAKATVPYARTIMEGQPGLSEQSLMRDAIPLGLMMSAPTPKGIEGIFARSMQKLQPTSFAPNEIRRSLADAMRVVYKKPTGGGRGTSATTSSGKRIWTDASKENSDVMNALWNKTEGVVSPTDINPTGRFWQDPNLDLYNK